MSVYVLDTNFFIQAHRASYPLDVVESFWLLVKRLANEGQIISIDKVRKEISRNEDILNDWVVQNLAESFFKPSDTESVLKTYADVAEWAETRSDHYKRAAVDNFLEFENADAWLVSYCISTECILVTQEVSDPISKNRIKLPDVCRAFDVKYCNMIQMFRELSVRF